MSSTQVIDLLSDEEEIIISTDHDRKRPSIENEENIEVKKIKSEFAVPQAKANSRAGQDDGAADDDIEIVDKPKETTEGPTQGSVEDDEIAVVGTKNEVLLPHMRQHCTVKPFTVPSTTTLSTESSSNLEFCDYCFCYVCDVPVKECKRWSTHCCATDRGPCAELCKSLRQTYRERKKKAASRPKPLVCRHCGSRFAKQQKPLPFWVCGDWCHCCGRVALEGALGAKQSKPYVPAANDIFLGTREIPFRAVIRNPRRMEKYKKAWDENKGKPGWDVNEEAEAVEFFEHRLGRRPVFDVIMMTIATSGPESVPTDGISHSSPNGVSADECDALVLDQEADLRMLRIMNDAGFCRSSWLHGDITTNDFDGVSHQGTITIRAYIDAEGNPHENNLIAVFLSHWYGLHPFTLKEMQFCLPATQGNNNPSREPSELPSEILDKAVRVYNTDVDNTSKNLHTLDSGCESQLLGDVCLNTTAELRPTLVRYIREVLPGWLCDYRPAPVPPRSKPAAGHSNGWRTLRKDPYTRSRFKEFNGKIDMLFDEADKAVILRAREAALTQKKETNSIGGLLRHLVDRGHESAEQVEGLVVNLLPFQRQSLQWAMERETVPGGVQAFHWVTLPGTTDAFYNPLLGAFSKKPSVVHGGILGEMNGLGKTLVILALILSNPAPEPASSQQRLLIASPTNTGSTRIVSRATLILCSASRRDHWLAQIKSKLTNPADVYLHDGKDDNVSPHLLAEKSIVIATYETMSAQCQRQAAAPGDHRSPCEGVHWWRIVCDESHLLATMDNSTLRSLIGLLSDKRWLVSGTPINTTVEDLTNQLRFLGLKGVNMIMNRFRATLYQHVRDPSRSKKSFFLGCYHTGAFTFFARPILMRHSESQRYVGQDTTLLMSIPSTETDAP